MAEHDDHVALEVTYLVYQDVIDAYEHPESEDGQASHAGQ